MNLAHLLAGVFQLRGDGRLSLRGDLRGIRHAVLQRPGHALQPLRHALSDGGDLPGALRLRRRDGLQTLKPDARRSLPPK